MSQLTEPQHFIEVGGVERRLRFRFSDWFRAENRTGLQLRSGFGIPFTTPAQTLPILLLVGLGHEMPGLTLEGAADLVDFDNEDKLTEACIKAVFDYEPIAKKKLLALSQVTSEQGNLRQMVELILSISTIESGPSESTTETLPVTN